MYAHYLTPTSGNNWHFQLLMFLAQPGPTPGDGNSTRSSFNWLQIGLVAGVGQLPSFASGVPHAYLRLLVYQADSTVLSDRLVPITTLANGTWQPLHLSQQLPAGAAYAQVYVANESNVPVWFGDLDIEHRPGLQVQENQYDPFGLDLAGLNLSTQGCGC